MFKNKKIVMVVVLILVMGVFPGCSSKKDTPEGFSKEFYKDIVKTSNEIMKEVPNIKKEDVINNTIVKFQSYSDFCDKYYDDYDNEKLTIIEEKTYKVLIGIVLNIDTDLRLHYEKGNVFPSNKTIEKIEELANLLEIDIDYSF